MSELKTCLGCGIVTHPWSWCEECDPINSIHKPFEIPKDEEEKILSLPVSQFPPTRSERSTEDSK